VPFQRPRLPALDAIDEYFALSRAEGWYSNFGPCYELLSERASAWLDNRPVVPVSSAGIGLIAALRALVPDAHGRARQVVLPPFTFAATAAAVVWCGLEPLFSDIEPEGWHLCPTRLCTLLAARPGRVAAVVACSAFGTPPPHDVAAGWLAACEEWDVPLIVDSAAGFGVGGWDRPPDVEIFSMHATKPLAAGEGGLVALADSRVAELVRTLINHGIGAGGEALAVGLNGKLDEWHSATALAALDRFPESLARRQAAAATMRRRLSPAGTSFQALADRSPAQFVPAIVASAERRAEILARAASLRVELRTYYSPLHSSAAYRNCARGDALAVTASIAGRMLSLPLAEDLSDDEQAWVAACFAP
jgi:dTDP-4-amino-4,6-dideoxygalactose transaminase